MRFTGRVKAVGRRQAERHLRRWRTHVGVDTEHGEAGTVGHVVKLWLIIGRCDGTGLEQARLLYHEGAESDLDEVVVSCYCIGESAVPHNNEGNTVRESAVLVGIAFVKVESTPE